MMIQRAILVLLATLPSAVFAQRGGGSSGTRRPTAGFSDSADTKREARPLTSDDIRDASPLHLLIDKRKDLKLSDAQLASLKDAESKLKDSTASSLKVIDSLNFAMKVASNSDDQDYARAAMARTRTAFMIVLSNIRTTYDASAASAVSQLTPEQVTAANDLIKKQADDFDKKIHERMGGGRS